MRDIIQRATLRTGVEAVFVANREIPGLEAGEVRSVIVEKSEGAADEYIALHSCTEDLVVTRDIPLARRLVDNGNTVLNDRGDVMTTENVGERLSLRNFMYHLRTSGLLMPAEKSFGPKEVQAFANAFDRVLTRMLRTDHP